MRSMGGNMDLSAVRKDGSGFPVEVSLTPMKVDDNLLVMGLVTDISDRKRSEERIAQALEAREHEPSVEAAPGAPAPARLPERVINRLVALGYERIELLTPAAEFEALVEGEGEIRVEARRSGATYKGRVLVNQGAIVEVALRPPYEIFP